MKAAATGAKEPAASKSRRRCAYCGKTDAVSVDHVVSRAMYPDQKVPPRNARITVPACVSCNNGWSKDEAFFRNVLAISGERTDVVQDLWETKIRRGFAQADGVKQARDLFAQMKRVEMPEGGRFMIFPAESERVLRIVRKTVRGLCHHHKVMSPVVDEQVWADVQRFEIPAEFLSPAIRGHAEEDILSYVYCILDEPEIHSFWALTFYKRTPFHCIVFRSAEARARWFADAANM